MPNRLPYFIYRLLTEQARSVKQVMMVVADIILLLLAAWFAYTIRLGQDVALSTLQWLLIGAAPLLAFPVFIRAGLYRSVIRYLGEQALWAIVWAMASAAALWALLAFMTQMSGHSGMPRTVPVLFWLVGTALVAGSRFGARWLLWTPVRRRYAGRQVLIYGAGGAGRQLAASLRTGREMFPAGFLDDDPGLAGKDIDGLRVYSPDHLDRLIERFDIHDVIVTLPTASAARRREIVEFLEQHDIRVRILPAMTDIANGKHLVNMVRQVDVGDLLGRDAVAPDAELMGRRITGKVVMVTGAGGSIGAELCRQIVTLAPSELILVETGEYALYQIDRALRSISSVPLVPRLASVRDTDRIRSMLVDHGVETIYHAAAYKHVPLVESNVIEGAANNVLGTWMLTRLAHEAGVSTFVLISSDKAVRPANVMGATKRWAELIVQDYSLRRRGMDEAPARAQVFCAVRFGNVLGSSGSVVPLFREQIAQGGPVTVTHPEVTRYFMSIHEAVQLVIQAGSLAEGGEIFLLDMGDPVRIVDLARNMIRLAGHTVRSPEQPEGDIEISFVGLRPGEKMYEELLIASGNAQGTVHPKITRSSEPGVSSAELEQAIASLESAIARQDHAAVRALVMAMGGR